MYSIEEIDQKDDGLYNSIILSETEYYPSTQTDFFGSNNIITIIKI